MNNRRPSGPKAPHHDSAGQEDLTLLVKMIAREAAREALSAFTEALTVPTCPGVAPRGPMIQKEARTAEESDAGKPIGSDERYFSVAQVAVRLAVSQKWVRRRIASGELPALRAGKLVRVGERALTACVGKAGLGKAQPTQ